MTTDLKPCPFCGSAATLDDERLLWVASCTGCGACVLGDRAPEPEQEMPTAYWEPFRQSAVDRWNRRAALAQPEPVDLLAQIHTLLDGIDRDECHPDGGWWQTSDGGKFGRIKLQELKELIASSLSLSRPTIQPVAVSERLPLHITGELDDQGTCWNYHPINLHYCLCVPDPSVHTHWLPANALPTPEATNA